MLWAYRSKLSNMDMSLIYQQFILLGTDTERDPGTQRVRVSVPERCTKFWMGWGRSRRIAADIGRFTDLRAAGTCGPEPRGGADPHAVLASHW